MPRGDPLALLVLVLYVVGSLLFLVASAIAFWKEWWK